MGCMEFFAAFFSSAYVSSIKPCGHGKPLHYDREDYEELYHKQQRSSIKII